MCQPKSYFGIETNFLGQFQFVDKTQFIRHAVY